ncbi:hypothetical protein GCM10009808_15170 [Microbacterium sediminicola]|uniref:Uncharacterized protein n=1 Tax=Microbacterium sediminicola TaxID=415210 RepID=A0ABP4U4L7_9MICO
MTVWVLAAVAGTVIGFVVPADQRVPWLSVVAGLSVAVSFAVQLASGRAQGFVARVGLSVLGAVLILGVISLGFGLSGLVSA